MGLHRRLGLIGEWVHTCRFRLRAEIATTTVSTLETKHQKVLMHPNPAILHLLKLKLCISLVYKLPVHIGRRAQTNDNDKSRLD